MLNGVKRFLRARLSSAIPFAAEDIGDEVNGILDRLKVTEDRSK